MTLFPMLALFRPLILGLLVDNGAPGWPLLLVGDPITGLGKRDEAGAWYSEEELLLILTGLPLGVFTGLGMA